MDEVHLTTPVSPESIRSLKLGDVVYLSGVLYTGREGVYRQVVDKGVALPDSVRALTNVNFHCSPAASVRPDGSYSVEAVTATASFRFGKSMTTWFERSGAKVIVGKAGLTELAYREWFVPHGAVYLTTVGYGLGAMERIGPFLVEGDAAGRSLFALANREVNLRIDEVYKTLPPPALSRFGEVLSRKDEVV